MSKEKANKFRCYACGDAENTDAHCDIVVFAGEPTQCPVTGEEADWTARVEPEQLEAGDDVAGLEGEIKQQMEIIEGYEGDIVLLRTQLAAKEGEIEGLKEKQTCMCMDCGKVMKVTEQSKHLKECPEQAPRPPENKAKK